ncbi:MAG: hypothetical protein C0425_10060 [Chlorobiaceae bacterium]|nr:hypothetical protein [Chlorobiaceae bacterium]
MEALMRFSTLFCSMLLSTNPKGTYSMNPPIRVIERQEGLSSLLPEIANRGGFSIIDDVQESKDGRIATNTVVQTNKGKLLIRAYPESMPEKLETGDFMFEIKALAYVASKGLNVPQLIQFNDGKNYLLLDNLVISAYPLIEGVTVMKEELTPEIGAKAGEFAAALAIIAPEFYDSKNFQEELTFIDNIFERRALNYPELKQDKLSISMLQYIHEPKLRSDLERTPQGLVHGDFFFENFVLCPDGRCALIDFGDAYCGYILSDICLSAMEFSALSEEEWNFDILKQFFLPVKSWMKANNIPSHLIVDHMKALCVKFLVYTIPFTCADGESIEKNPYRQRFAYLSRPEIVDEITRICG